MTDVCQSLSGLKCVSCKGRFQHLVLVAVNLSGDREYIAASEYSFVVAPIHFYSECKTDLKKKDAHYVLHSPYKNVGDTTVEF